MKYEIYCDELYPFFGINLKPGRHEIPEELLQRWLTCMKEFQAIQNELETILEAEIMEN